MPELESKVTLPEDFAALAEMCGCTLKQRQFAERLLRGASFVEAAHGVYAGERNSVQLRSAGSEAARSRPVQALLALAKSRGFGVSGAPGDSEELLNLLWMQARSEDKNVSFRAAVELRRIEREEQAPEPDPVTALNELAGISPLCALHLAIEDDVKLVLSDGQLQDIGKAIELLNTEHQRRTNELSA